MRRNKLTRTLEDEYGLPWLDPDNSDLPEGQFLPRTILYAMYKGHALTECWQSIDEEVECPDTSNMIMSINLLIHHAMRALIVYSSLDWKARDKIARVMLKRWKFPKAKYTKRPWKVKFAFVNDYEVSLGQELEKAFDGIKYDDIIFPNRAFNVWEAPKKKKAR